jgi:2-polyprenyl-3-methyl-5-hydroxy-6-metoxy-1,4-benzoquinol methylase
VNSAVLPQPRWGNEDRERKAVAVFRTLEHFSTFDIAQARWLDIGCGSGGMAAALAGHAAEVTGIDPEPWPQWTALMQQHANLRLLQGGYDSDPLCGKQVDVVVCNQVYEHVPDPVRLIRFMHASLRPGGIAYFAGPNLLFPIEPHTLWPFVHWLPRSFAVGLMRALGSRKILDANSTSYWKLQAWLAEFETRNAVPWVLRNPERLGRHAAAWRCLKVIPAPLFEALTCLSPAFVFVLVKR